MINSFKLPPLPFQVWILTLGRLLSQMGSGFTLFYAPIFFVNQIGLSPTLVGIALGSGSISGVLGRFIGGTLSDLKGFGRKKTLLISLLISAIACAVFVVTQDFITLVMGNLLVGFAVGLYWPATEATVADLTSNEIRNEAFAISRLADNLGLGIGVVLGGLLVSGFGSYRGLFIADGISFLVFFVIIYIAIEDTSRIHQKKTSLTEGWLTAFQDKSLLIYLGVNILFTTYLSQIQSTLPLYFKNFVTQNGGFSESIVSGLFTWHIVFASLCQLPMARFLNRFPRTKGLMISMVLWGIGFLLIGLTGFSSQFTLFYGILALGICSLAMVAYTPSASSLVVDLAPIELRGVYLSLNSQCWAIGYFIGPPLGGWALDRSTLFAHQFWLYCAISILGGIVILKWLEFTQNSTGDKLYK